MRITINYGTQTHHYTPTEEPGVNTVTVQATDDAGVPRSDVTFLHMSGSSGELYLFPVLISGIRHELPKIIAMLQRAILFANIHGGDFDERKFIEARLAELNRPLPAPLPQPDPVVIEPVPPTGALTLSTAQVQIDAYARGRGGDIGPAIGDVFPMSGLPGTYARNYGRGGQTKDICIVVCSKDGTYLVRNDFMLSYSGNNFNNRSRLGAPVEDERGTGEGAEQKFKRGRMLWRRSTGKVEVYDAQGNRIS